VDGCNRAYPHILFVHKSVLSLDVNRRDDYEIHGTKVFGLRWADTNMNVTYDRCMRAKYDTYGLDFNIWKENAMWERDREKEDSLFDMLGCGEGEYNLVNSIFGSQSQLRIPIEVSNGVRNVNMRTIPGYSLFDWQKVLENAKEIHSVSTSLIYILECLELSQPIHLYCRKPLEYNFDTVIYILKSHDYILHL